MNTEKRAISLFINVKAISKDPPPPVDPPKPRVNPLPKELGIDVKKEQDLSLPETIFYYLSNRLGF